MNEKVLTFDADWAPDWAIEMCAIECEKADVPFTFFVTNESSSVNHLREIKDVELGIHPNFLESSTQGKDPQSVMSSLLNLVPEATSMRTHSLIQSSPLMNQIAQVGRIQNDVSLFLPFSHNLEITQIFYQGGSLTRLPYSWEDDEAMQRGDWSWTVSQWPRSEEGRYVWDFHPIHVVLNSSNFENYNNLKLYMGQRPLNELTEQEANKFKNHDRGTMTYFRELLRKKYWNWVTVDTICKSFRSEC